MNFRKILTFCFVILSYSMKRASAVTEPRQKLSNVTTTISKTNEDVTVTNKTRPEIKTTDKPKDVGQDYSGDNDYEMELSSEELKYSGRINEKPRNTNYFDLGQFLKDKGTNKTVNENDKNKLEESEMAEVTSTKGNRTNVVLENKSFIPLNNHNKNKSYLESKKVIEALKINPIKLNNTYTQISTKNYTAGLLAVAPEQKIKSNTNETLSESSKNMTLLRETQKQLGFNYTIPHDPVPKNIKRTENQNQQQSKLKTNLEDKINIQSKVAFTSNSLLTSTEQEQATVSRSENNNAQNATFQKNHARNVSVQNNDAQNVTFQNSDSKNATFQNNDPQNVRIQNNYAQNATFQKNDPQNVKVQSNDAQNATIKKNDAQNLTVQNNDAQKVTFQNNNAQNATVQNNNPQNVRIQNNDAQNSIFQNNNAQNATIQNNYEQNVTVQNNDARNATLQNKNAQNVTTQNNDAQNATFQKNDAQNVTIQDKYAQNVTLQNNDAQNVTFQNNDSQNATFQNNDAQNATIKNNDAHNDAQNATFQNNDTENGPIKNIDERNATFQTKDVQNATVEYLKPIFLRETQKQKNEKPFQQRPHILFIVADDLGWGDVSLHGSDQIMTPNLDILAYTGVVLSQYYTDVQGTASRSALFTGKYPLRLGTVGDSIGASEDRGIPVVERLLPRYLRALGYDTHLVGKWDVGKSRQQYLPTARGFDTFYGSLGGAVDYYTYNQIEVINGTSYFGCDMYNGSTPAAADQQQGYLTDVITDRAMQIIRSHKTDRPLYLHVSHLAPHAAGGLATLQAPAPDIQANQHIAHSARRLYAGMVTSLDNSIGDIIAALDARGMLHNTLVVFVADNGAPTAAGNFGTNLPLRGGKGTPWEGAARTTGIVWKQSLGSKTFPHLFHVTDWLPTLISAAGANGNVDEKLDGLDQWRAVSEGDAPKRTDLLVSIDESWAALREGHFKVIVGDVDEPTSRSTQMEFEFQRLRRKPPPYETVLVGSTTYRIFHQSLNLTLNVDEALAKRRQFHFSNQMLTRNASDFCVPNKDKGCLYNITRDPLELVDLWDTYPDIVRRLTLRLRTIWSELKPRRRPARDPRADPALHGYVWRPWVDNEEVMMGSTNLTSPPFPLQVSLGEIQYLVDLNLNMFRQTVVESIKAMGNSFLKTVNGLF